MVKVIFLLILPALLIPCFVKADESIEEMYKSAEKINSQYIKNVKAIFSKKCFDCHSNQTVFPWYHSIPGVKQLLESDIKKGKKHIDMSDDFPFGGHGSIDEDLIAIKNSINKNEMPPFKYWFMHPGARWTQDEKRIVNEWVDESLKTLNSHN